MGGLVAQICCFVKIVRMIVCEYEQRAVYKCYNVVVHLELAVRFMELIK